METTMIAPTSATAGFCLLALTTLLLIRATRRTSFEIGRNAYGFGGNRRQVIAQMLFRVSVLTALSALATHAAFPDLTATAPFMATGTIVETSGIGLAVLGMALTLFARSDMGRRWRVGVPNHAPEGLVTDGLFAYSRNPVFCGMIAMGVGLALAVPSAPVVAAAIAFIVACCMQVGDEERFLSSALGDEYERYCANVRRWF